MKLFPAFGLCIYLAITGCAYHPQGETVTFDGAPPVLLKHSTAELFSLESAPLNTAEPGKLTLYFVYVGQGDCTLVNWPDGTWSMVDCGTTWWSGDDADERKVCKYVRGLLGPNPRLRSLIITHPDADHLSLIPYVLDGVEIDEIFYTHDLQDHKKQAHGPFGWPKPKNVAEWMKQSPNLTDLTQQDIDPADQDSDWFEDSACKVYLLATDVGRKDNDKSVVLLLEYGEFRAMLTADATHVTEQAISKAYAANPDFLDVDVYKIGHHGSIRTSTSEHWAALVKPETSIVSAGFTNDFGHPSWKVIERLEEYANTRSRPHKLRGFYSSNSPANTKEYRHDIFSTASSGNVVVSGKRDGRYTITVFDK